MKKTQEYKIDPKEYKKILKTVDLQSIAIEACSVKFNKKTYDTRLVININSETSYENLENGSAIVKERYKLIARVHKERKQALNISCTFRLDFSCDKPLSDDFFEIFKTYNLPLNTWPYFREFVQNMTQRMNIPPLTLPFMK
ncbi:MAG: hypothetical protein AVO38_08325 [delta proteobacterium ML8_D]|nr:MAG: hypothetical protein AVO38_08325 [delta proteobacterium ML8_D]